MYHYVQPKGLKGIVPLEPDDFKNQLEWVAKNYDIISPDQIHLSKGLKPFCILTFDDATKDQYEIAFHILKQKGIPAYFTVMSGPLLDRKIPIVHLVHSVLSSYSDQEIWFELNTEFNLNEIDENSKKYYFYEKDPFRRKNKYALNFVLSEEQSRSFLERKIVAKFDDIDSFIDQYYITLKEWLDIKVAGMTIGVHAVNHRPFSGDAQIFFNEEIEPCRSYMRTHLGIEPIWYTPAFGGGIQYTEMMNQLEPILRREGFRGGFTTQHGYINETDSFWFKRIDCVKLPPIK